MLSLLIVGIRINILLYVHLFLWRYDGDTIDVKMDRKTERIRFLCIDTPEIDHTDSPSHPGDQPYGGDAKAYIEKEIGQAKHIQLELGVNGGTGERYGRLLAYVYIDGKMLNELLLENGLAMVRYVIPPNTKYANEFYEIEKKAKEKKLSVWSIDGYAQNNGYHKEVIP